MPNRLIKGFAPSTDNRARSKEDLLSQSRRFPWWLYVVPIVMVLGLLSGCVGASQQVRAAQALPQTQPSDPNQELQQQLMLQTSRDSLVSYKDYQVGPEDILTIDIYGQDKLSQKSVRVNGQGELTLPLVGVVKVAGLTAQEIEKRLTALYDAQYLVNPQITVGVKDVAHQQVAVTGAVAKPGTYKIIGPRTLLEVLALAGGFAGTPAGDTVNVIRHQNAPDLVKTMKTGAHQPEAQKTETMVIDIRRLVSGQAPELNITVRNGDVVHVPFAGAAYVMGGVRKPGSIIVKENLTVSQAVALAGGIEPILGTNSITIMRLDEQGKPININTNLNRILARSDPDLPINNNDVVVVNESTIKKTIYVLRALLPIPTPGLSF